jgi:sterol desaturase/sphingolipid hydroxylase (fatty acid hydroxylase superfamily)
MPALDTLGWYALLVPLYVVFIGIEMALARQHSERVFSQAEAISNLTAGLGTMLVGLFVGPWVSRGWDLVHDHVAPWRWPASGAWRLPAALLVADFCYYVYHFAGHRFAIFWSIHGIHHQHEHFNSTVGLRLEWLADPYAALFFVLMPLVGIDSTTGFVAIALLSAYTLTAHAPVLARPSWGLFVTPATHGAHHSRDGRFLHKNYGAMLGIWDRLFGTWLEPARGERLRSDLPTICRTHNGVEAQWGLVRELGRALRDGATLRARLRLLVSRPVLADAPTPPPREDAAIAPATRIYVLIQFLALLPLAAWILWFRARPLPVQLGGSLVLVGGFYALGALLDGRAGAARLERARLWGTALFGVALVGYAPLVGATLAVVALGHLAAAPALGSTCWETAA